jgi:predicted AAA+ superfamily ATPase
MNALTGNFNPLPNRTDAGILWENFVISEFFKQHNNQDIPTNLYFWRTYDGAEIDLVIERNQNLSAFEIKWSKKRKAKLPESFRNKYGVEELLTINPENLHILFDPVRS